MPSFRDRTLLPLAIVSSILCWGACSPDVLNPTDDTREATFFVVADVSAALSATVVVEVTAPDITAPLVFNIPIVGTTASGTITVPVGLQRTIAMRAFDVTGIETHTGSVTIDVVAGPNPTITLTLLPVTGDVVISVTLGTVTVTVAPSDDTLEIGTTGLLTAAVLDGNGNPVAIPVAWATLAAGVATVERISDVTGLVTGVGPGVTTIVATVGAFGGAATVVVSATPTLQLVASGLAAPVYLTAPPGDATRLFVVERAGRIRVIENDVLLVTPFLDIRSFVNAAGERGLLSMAFHPDYAVNGEFFVDYNNVNGDTRVVRYTVSAADPNVANPDAVDTVLTVTQPAPLHVGGLATFGPDNMLYVGLGDGELQANGQDSTTLHGTLLRLNVDAAAPFVPAGNPFVADPAARDEIWAYGLRNPWRFSFDRLTGDLYIADVGWETREEVDVQLSASSGGENYGWNIMEGTFCLDPTRCPRGVLPVLEYDHTAGCSIIGGYVYRGSALPALVGQYFYGDFCSGWIRSFRFDGAAAVEERDWTPELGILPGFALVSFGEDGNGELYVISQLGDIHRIAPSGS